MKNNMFLAVFAVLLLIPVSFTRAMDYKYGHHNRDLAAAIVASLVDAQDLNLTEEEDLQLAIAASKSEQDLQRSAQVLCNEDEQLARVLNISAQEVLKKQEDDDSLRLAYEIAAYELKGQQEQAQVRARVNTHEPQAQAQAQENNESCPICLCSMQEIIARDGNNPAVLTKTNCCKQFICAKDVNTVRQSRLRCPLCRSNNP